MPLYEYVCEKCDHPFEALLTSKEEQAACPQCASKRVARQLSLPAAPPSSRAPDLPPCGPACCRLPAKR